MLPVIFKLVLSVDVPEPTTSKSAEVFEVIYTPKVLAVVGAVDDPFEAIVIELAPSPFACLPILTTFAAVPFAAPQA